MKWMEFGDLKLSGMFLRVVDSVNGKHRHLLMFLFPFYTHDALSSSRLTERIPSQ